MLYKLFIKIFLAAAMLFSSVLLGIIYISDPYALFHRPLWHKDLMYDNLRIQDYGLIKYEDFDGIILGSSMLENSSADEVSQKIGGQWVNLSFSSARFYEKFSVLNFALRNKKLRGVIMSLDSYHLLNFTILKKHLTASFRPIV